RRPSERQLAGASQGEASEGFATALSGKVNASVKWASDTGRMRFAGIVCTFAALLLAPLAEAADLRVAVTGADGRPVADAVVTVRVARPPSGRIQFPWPMRIAQEHMEFDPFVLIAPTGATVAFPNLDPVRHHVYSFSPAG